MSKRIGISFKTTDNRKVTELNQILDKISDDKRLSHRETDFLTNYVQIKSDDIRDYNYLTLLDLFYIIHKINKTIICDIKDKQGKIGDQIIKVDYDQNNCIIILELKHGSIKLTDNNLYKLSYQFKHDNYSLDIESEYYEKINLEK